MQRRVWKARVLPGKLEEYKKRHDEIWPEMARALRSCGITNYTIWNSGSELIGYYECPDLKAVERCQMENEVMHKWRDSMVGIMEMEQDPDSGTVRQYRQIFELM